ncbi:MAG: hypothetical protein JNJ54_27460 [Myxococcaceae bacterium]|nr:hypothetical protein [Myxococcaceae bacterium]
MESRLDSLDRACLAATREPWSSFAPTWKLDLSVRPEADVLQRAVDWAVRRTPWVSARVVGDTWVLPDAPQLVFSSAADEQEVLDRFLDVSQAPVELVLVPRDAGGVTLLFHQHHAVADGRAFLEFLGDFMSAWQAVERGERVSPLPPDLVLRRRHREVITTRGLARAGVFLGGALVSLAELARAVLRPVAALPSNTGTDFTGRNRSIHHFEPLTRIEAWRQARTRLGLSTNDLLAGALLRSLNRWSSASGTEHTLLFPIDVRPREGFRSFANHLSNLHVRWRTSEGSALDCAKHVHDECAEPLRRRAPWRRVLFDSLVAALTPVRVLRRALLDERRLVTNFSFSNLLPLGLPGADDSGVWRTRSCTVEAVRITTPCVPPQAVNLTVVRSGTRACFNFNFKDSAISEDQVRALITFFQESLDELDARLR